MKPVVNSIPLLYLLMLFSGQRSILDLANGRWYYPQMMMETGQLSVWYLTLALSVTPALLMINRIGRGTILGVWLLKRRKHFGLMSFVFALVHLIHYIRYTGDLAYIWIEVFRIEFAVGWLAFVIFLALAVTSNRMSVRRLGTSWKPLHRLVYIAAAMSFLHWFLFDEFTARVLFWLAILLIAKLAHIGLRKFSFRLFSKASVN